MVDVAGAGEGVCDVEVAIRPQRRTPPRDQMIAALADRQQRVVAHWQLIEMGCSGSSIQRRIRAGRLHVHHRGVYSVGCRKLTVRGRWMAAVLACGPEAVLSHRDAAALHGLRPTGSRKAIHVTSPGGRKRPRKGIVVHNVRHLRPGDRTVVDGIPVTSVHRTLLDYAETASPNELRWAFEAYDRQDLLDLRKIDAVIARNPGRRGIKRLMKLTAAYRGPPPDSRSGYERRLLAHIREAGLPEPSVNVVAAEGIVVDLYWPQYKLVIEIDSYRYHHTPADRAVDRRKTRMLRAAGREVQRVMDTDIDDAPGAVIEDITAALSACAARSATR